MTPEEADEFLLMLAPAVEAAARVVSSKRDGVTSEDTPPNLCTPAAKYPPRESASEQDSFPGKSGEPGEATADENIRRAATPTVTLDAFLAAFHPTEAEPVNLRAFAPKGAPAEPRFEARKISASRAALAEGGGLLAQLRKINGACGLYFVVNQGSDRDDELNRVTAFFAEADEQDIIEQHAKLDACPLPPSIRVESRKSVHAYRLAAPACSVEEWREVQKRLIHYFGSDPKIKNPSRVMRLPGFNHVTYTNGPLDFKPVTLSAFDPSRRYTAAEMLAVFPAPTEPERRPVNLFTPRLPESNLEEHKRQLGERIVRHESARRNGAGKWYCRGVCHGGKGSTGLFYDPADNGVTCNSGCDLATISAAFGLAMPERGAPANGRERGTI